MKAMRQQKSWMALLALVFLFASCKGESPTAPPPGGGGGTGGGGTPTTGTSISLTASNANPVVDSIVLITAAVTINGQPAPDGTAVEFAATGGSFSATETVTAILRTTVNGVATVQLRSTVAGTIRVQAAVGSVSRTVDVVFKVSPTIPPPDSQLPSITSVSPTLGIPSGGQRIQIIGKNFKEPVRVLFNTGAAQPVEAFVVSRTDTLIEVLTPSVNLGAGQQLIADVIVITQAGTVNEARAELSDSFTFRAEVLTPRVSTATPNSGPVTGGTRVTIFGDGFQAPVQVLFGAAEARVVTVEFSQIIVEAPAARDTSDNGSGTVTGPVSITVRNINSQTEVSLGSGFRYVAAMDITSFRPLVGPATGGTDVVIDGIGFLAPVDVTIAGVRATVLQVTGTRILVRTGALPSACAGVSGDVLVTNVNNGDFERFVAEPFEYVAVLPMITSTSPTPAVAGQNLSITVRDPGIGPLGAADIRFETAGRTLIPNPDRITTGSGTQGFSVVLPLTGFSFPTVACDAGGGLIGTQLGNAEATLTFNNLSNGCSASTTIFVTPPPSLPNPCVPPSPQATVTNPATTTCPGLAFGNVPFAAGSVTQDVVITNSAPAGSANLVISTAIVTSGGTDFSVNTASIPASLPPGASVNVPVTFDPTVAGARTGNVRFTTNDPARPTIDVCLTGTGT
jgi:hypothetical protein